VWKFYHAYTLVSWRTKVFCANANPLSFQLPHLNSYSSPSTRRHRQQDYVHLRIRLPSNIQPHPQRLPAYLLYWQDEPRLLFAHVPFQSFGIAFLALMSDLDSAWQNCVDSDASFLASYGR
jgi:hypothetical protein